MSEKFDKRVREEIEVCVCVCVYVCVCVCVWIGSAGRVHMCGSFLRGKPMNVKSPAILYSWMIGNINLTRMSTITKCISRYQVKKKHSQKTILHMVTNVSFNE